MNSTRPRFPAFFSYIDTEKNLIGPHCSECMRKLYHSTQLRYNVDIYHHQGIKGVATSLTLAELSSQNGSYDPFLVANYQEGIPNLACATPSCNNGKPNVEPHSKKIITVLTSAGTQTPNFEMEPDLDSKPTKSQCRTVINKTVQDEPNKGDNNEEPRLAFRPIATSHAQIHFDISKLINSTSDLHISKENSAHGCGRTKCDENGNIHALLSTGKNSNKTALLGLVSVTGLWEAPLSDLLKRAICIEMKQAFSFKYVCSMAGEQFNFLESCCSTCDIEFDCVCQMLNHVFSVGHLNKHKQLYPNSLVQSEFKWWLDLFVRVFNSLVANDTCPQYNWIKFRTLHDLYLAENIETMQNFPYTPFT